MTSQPLEEQKSNPWTDPRYHWVLFLGSVLFIGLLAYIDALDGPEVHLSALYMIPVYFSTWYIGFRAGAALSLLSGLTLLIDPIFYPHFYSGLGVVIWNLVSLLVVNATFSLALTLLKRKFIQVHEQLRRDDLTGLLNAGAFFELAERERLRSIRYGHPVTVCFLDLDNFKKVNDTIGHMAGSELLKMTAETLRRSVRETDQVARLGGDEFVILFPETGPAAVDGVISKIQKDLNDRFRERACETTPSMGVATFCQMPPTVNDLVHQADQLMYNAKKNGKNKITTRVFGA